MKNILQSNFITAVAFFSLWAFVNLKAQDFLLQGWYWDYPKTANGYNWADSLKDKAQEFSNSGFTYVWLPPFTRTSFGNNSNGYDPKDLFDLGEFGQGPTQFGTRTDVDNLISAFSSYGIKAVADVVYNHRDGGKAENNPAVEGWIENFNNTKFSNGDQPYPSDRFRCILPIGGATGRGAGNYYFKIKSASQNSAFFNYEYKVYMQTNKVGFQNLPANNESEPNGGGDCGEPNNLISLGVDMIAHIDGLGCKVDEFHLNLTSNDFNASGDTIFIYLNNTGAYSDHYIYGLYYDGTSSDIQSALEYQTYTDFTNLPSGRGDMNYTNFKPNGNPTCLCGDWDYMYFFYDYDQSVNATRDTLNAWTKWLWQDVGIRGYRMDAVKHFNYTFTAQLLNFLHTNGIDPGMAVGEFFDSNPAVLKGWIDNVLNNMSTSAKSVIHPRLFDFSLRQALKDASDSYGYDVRNVFTSGIVDGAGGNGFNSVTFANNHDFRDPGQPIENDPILAYAYLLTNNQVGLPSVFYPDYISLKGKIDTLIIAHKNFIFGSTGRDYLSRNGTPYNQNFISGFNTTTLIYQLMNTPSGRDVIAAINYAGDTLKVYQEINMSNIPPNEKFTDIIGNSSSQFVNINSNDEIYIELPPRSYSVWVQGDAALPVELTFFNAFKKNNFIELNWETATEQNNYGFDLERSPSPTPSQREGTFQNNWQKIGFVQGHGNTNSPKNYSFVDKNISSGKYLYRLKQIDTDGSYKYSKTVEVLINDLQNNFSLEQNYPNPFNPSTIIEYSIRNAGLVSLKVYDILGREVTTLINKFQNAGNYKVIFSGKDLPAGIYYYRIKSNEYSSTKKLILLK